MYTSPLGDMLLACCSRGMTGCWFVGQKNFPSISMENVRTATHPYLNAGQQYLDSYFARDKALAPIPPLYPIGTPFQLAVWKCLSSIPYGTTTTYGDISKQTAAALNKERVSAQTVGNAVGHNPLSIFIPCHRVVGQKHQLAGYAGGIWRKWKLLAHEGVDMQSYEKPQEFSSL